MKRAKLKRLIFMALCCDLGLFAKKLILPAANILTDSLHIPGGVGTSFSLMFVVAAAFLVPRFGCAALMGAVQSVIALCMGTVGSMGILAPLGYILPCFAIDCVLWIARRLSIAEAESTVIANALASAVACLIANALVFRLHGIVLLLYLSVSLTSGTICGALAGSMAEKLHPIFGKDDNFEKKYSRKYCGTAVADSLACAASSENTHAFSR